MCVDNNYFSERYINLMKNRQCFKKLLSSKQLVSNGIPYFVFLCPRLYKHFIVVDELYIDVELKLVEICDKHCNISSENL